MAFLELDSGVRMPRFWSRHQIWNKYSLVFHTGDIVAAQMARTSGHSCQKKNRQTYENSSPAFSVIHNSSTIGKDTT